MKTKPALLHQHYPMKPQALLMLVAIMGGAWLLLGASMPRPSFTGVRPRNIVILLADDLGYGDLGCYGNPVIQTPHLDRLAARSLRFTHCYASAPVCSPSRAGLLTGVQPNRLGIYDWIPENSPMHLPVGQLTIASLLKQAGYQTALFGKWHLNGYFNQSRQPQPGSFGFDTYFATQNNAAPSHHNPVNFVANGQAVGPLRGYSCQLLADKAISWLKTRDRRRPFFQHICFHEPHEPVASPDSLVRSYERTSPVERAAYYANVTNLDAAVGRILNALEAEGLLQETLIIFTSDNGPETLNRYAGAARSYGTAGPLRERKLWLYEGGIRVPGLISWPTQIKPGVSSEPVSNLDFLPTIASVAGLRVGESSLDGVDISPLWQGRQRLNRQRPLFWFYYNALGQPRAVMRRRDWKIVGLTDSISRVTPNQLLQQRAVMERLVFSRFELYNLTDDPAETTNRAAAQPRLTRRLARQLQQEHKRAFL